MSNLRDAQRLADALLPPKIVNDVHYNHATPDAVVNVLENARNSHTRLRLFYGDTATGRDWLEENDVIGTVSRTIGPRRAPLLIHNSLSNSGPQLLDHCIVRILRTRDGHELYRHPRYQVPVLEVVHDCSVPGYCAKVTHLGSEIARFKTREAADRWAKFMTGQRFSK